MVTDMTTVLVKQDNRSRIVAREVHSMRGILEDLLFRVTSLENEVKDVGARASTAAPSANKKRAKKSDGGIAGWERKMENKFPNLHLYFPPALWKHAILYAAFEHLHTYTNKYDRDRYMYTVAGLLLARKNHANKDIYDKPAGQSASAFRRIVLTKALELARAKTYANIKPTNGDVKVEQNPYWLGPFGKEMYITKTHVQAGQTYHEKKTSNTAAYNRRVSIGDGAEPERDDYAAYIMIRMYDIMSRFFIARRRKVRNNFCESFGYLFHKWTPVKDCLLYTSPSPRDA